VRLDEEAETMPKYLLEVRYNQEGLKGVVAKGGSARVTAGTAAVESAGGTVESFYFAFGDIDVYVVADLPDNAAAASVALAVGAGGGASVRTVPMLTPEEVDRAAKGKVDYRPPGS
jgi:uncharacterized protein with GYD domain